MVRGRNGVVSILDPEGFPVDGAGGLPLGCATGGTVGRTAVVVIVVTGVAPVVAAVGVSSCAGKARIT